MNSKFGYWIATAPILFIMGAGGVYDILRPPPVIEVITHLGYPAYFPVMLGVAKVLGVIALLYPRSGVLREWAYAGFTFNLIAASLAHVFVDDPLFAVLFPIALLVPLFASRHFQIIRGSGSSDANL